MQMEAQWIVTRCAESEPHGDEYHAKLVIVVDGRVEIIVYGYGQGDAVLRVRCIDPHSPALGSPIVEQDVWDTMAPVLVWAEPLTIAHLVVDTIQNQ